NRELEALEESLAKLPELLRKGAYVCVISFHSLEDRIVKHNFRENAANQLYTIVTKKPLEPTEQEIADNPRSRSAKMRISCKI
ncbi:MAG TPA: 16S rRNA (cytosine(1402)-N(4))-methyltransferase, partial [Candidatus Omnitrophica bacterium]|nr:16S rRNA (cytosine(1402)-N(4))-methyltransferase [Candidatus Omnitrophota bacterium]